MSSLARDKWIAGKPLESLNIAVGELERTPNSPQLLLLAGKSALAIREYQWTEKFLSQIPTTDGSFIQALIDRGTAAFLQGRAADAERLLAQAIELEPANVPARNQLLRLYLAEGRDWDAWMQLVPLIQSGAADPQLLALAALMSQGEGTSEKDDAAVFEQLCQRAVPDDPLPQLASAKRDRRENRASRAIETASRIVAAHPLVLEAQALLGQLYAENGDAKGFLDWLQRLPKDANGHPGVWIARALWFQSRQQPVAAARCYIESLRRNPQSLYANHQLIQLLKQLNREADAAALDRLTDDLRRTLRLLDDPKLMEAEATLREAINLLLKTGRDAEAAAWCQFALDKLPGQVAWPRSILWELGPRLATNSTMVRREKWFVYLLDLNDFPLPAVESPSETIHATTPMTVKTSRLRFLDETGKCGIDFQFQSGAVSEKYKSILEMDGGGIGVVDYDCDGWPDLFFTQGGQLPLNIPDVIKVEFSPGQPQDCLYRNLGQGMFQKVTQQGLPVEAEYGQGMAVGDYNNDGFADIYVANAGPNCFLRNNGDGTFTDVSRETSTAGDEWTSCAVLADINQDGLPDLYLVNYIDLKSIRARLCERQGASHCVPADYPAAADQLFLNLGDGQFREVTRDAAILDEKGQGLGIVAADFDESDRISFFVANDASANFFFKNIAAESQSGRPASAPIFQEIARLNGTAFNEDGMAQSGMGIACGDADGDGRLDLFVTNFYQQSNTLYCMQPDGDFAVRTRVANLRDGSYYMLGWGTQFLDADLDGWLDLVLTNGHVDRPTNPQIPYEMPAQFYRNQGQGRFELLSPQDVGPHFERRLLGRALVCLDWNRDGRPDICISHLTTPVALLTNHSEETGRFVSLKFVGTRRSRDAIGTRVEVHANGRTQWHQLTAGDGYQCASEKRLLIGVGSAEEIEELIVIWPGQRRQEFHHLKTNHEYLFVEGESSPYSIP